MNAIEIRRLAKHYGRTPALAGIDLDVPAGSRFGFLGPNGAGKSTTLRILVGLLRATGGQARVFGRDAWRDAPKIAAQLGYLPGDVRLYEWMTGRAFLSFCDRARGGGSMSEARRVCEVMKLEVDRRIGDYSRGMKQKLALIQALMHRPRLLILDEPTTALDPLVQQALYAELRTAAEQGRTILFSSHTLSEVEALCDRVAIIRAGRIVECSTIASLTSRALRRVELRWRGPAASRPRPPEGFIADHEDDDLLTGSWKGTPDRLVDWLAAVRPADVIISPPRLDDLFAAYYRDDAPSREASA